MFLCLSLLRFGSALPRLGDGYLGQGDAPQSVWYLAWGAHALLHWVNPFLTDAASFHQEGGINLMWNNNMLTIGVLTAPITWLFGPLVSYNIALILAFPASALAAYVCSVRLGMPHWAGFAAGLMYGYSPFFIAHSVGHLNLVVGAVPPLTVVLFNEVVIRQKMRTPVAALLVAGLIVTAVFTYEETVALIAILALLGVLVLGVFLGRPSALRLRYSVRVFLLSAAFASVLLAYPLVIQFKGPWRLSGFQFDPSLYVADLLNFIVPTQVQWLAPDPLLVIAQRFGPNYAEQTAYLGLPLLVALSSAYVVLRSSIRVRVLALLSVCTAVLSMGPWLTVGGRKTAIPLPWLALQQLPLINDIFPGRLGEWVALFVALAFGACLSLASRRMIAMLLVSLIPLVPAQPVVFRPVPVVPTALREISSGSMLAILPWQTSLNYESALWQAMSDFRFRTEEGPASYGPFGPPGMMALTAEIVQGSGIKLTADRPLKALLAGQLAHDHVDMVVASADLPKDQTSFWTEAFGQPTARVDALVWRPATLAVYARDAWPDGWVAPGSTIETFATPVNLSLESMVVLDLYVNQESTRLTPNAISVVRLPAYSRVGVGAPSVDLGGRLVSVRIVDVAPIDDRLGSQ